MKEKDTKKVLKKIREAEEKMLSATPAQAAKLTSRIVRLKSTVFD